MTCFFFWQLIGWLSNMTVRHLYFPCLRKGFSKASALLVVFFFSAVMHELLISVPFHMVGYWSFLGMMAQIPLVFVTKYLQHVRPGTSLGNILFWVTFCIVGQPMAILMYTIDFWKLKHDSAPQEVEPSTVMECKKFLFFNRCDELWEKIFNIEDLQYIYIAFRKFICERV